MYNFLFHGSVKLRLTTVLIVVLLAGFAVTNVVNFRVSRGVLRERILTASLPLTSDNIYSEIQKDLMKPIHVSSLMAHDTFLKDWVLGGEHDEDRVRQYLLEIKNRYGFFTTFFVSERSGNYYHYDGILKRISPKDAHDVWYYQFKAKDREYVLDLDTNEAAMNSLTVFINHRLLGQDGELLGVVGVGLKAADIATTLRYYQEKYDSTVFLVDTDGLVQMHSDPSYIKRANIQDMPGVGGLAGDILKVDQGVHTLEYQGEDGLNLLLVRYIPEFNWLLVVEQGEAASLLGIRTTLYKNLSFSFVIILLVVGLTVLAVNYFQGQLERMALTDSLTEVANRRQFEEHFEAVRRSCERGACDTVSVVLLDVDDFKKVNDTHGHLVGDEVLQKVADAAMEKCRPQDVLARWGGDEFTILTLAGLDHAEAMAERIRTGVGQIRVSDGRGGDVAVSVTCGVAELGPGEALDGLLTRVDEALYEAKTAGKNRTVSKRG